MSGHIDVITTTISGSIKDWGKVKHIVPLFNHYGETDVALFEVTSHLAAREKARELIQSGSRILISAGGSGTFNSVLEGCYDARVDLTDLRLGFLRKGSADLIGKTLGMPDDIEQAVEVFVYAIRNNHTIPCDVLIAESGSGEPPPRHFVGYGGAEIFGEIPRYTENRFIKYYKGILGQLFGDLGPFFVGTNLAILGGLPRRMRGKKRQWEIRVDDSTVSRGVFQAMIIVNGDLGPNLPFARLEPLGSGRFFLFIIRDRGIFNLYRQLKHAFDGSIMDDPIRWGFESFCVKKHLEMRLDCDETFPVNVDGSIMECVSSARFRIIDQIHLFSNKKPF
ncbi:diacylglycerol/lipid kinase family protein [Candidatus Latescibacterota bacterium]